MPCISIAASFENGIIISSGTICENDIQAVGNREIRFSTGISDGSIGASPDIYCEGSSSPFDGHETLTDDLWAYYTMDDDSGDDATGSYDSVPSSPAPTEIVGINNGGLHFYDALTVTWLDIETPGAIADWTIAAWFYMPSSVGWGGSYMFILSTQGSAVPDNYFIVGQPSTGIYTHGTALTTDAWHHVAISNATSAGSYYIVLDGDWAGRKYAAGGASVAALNPSRIGTINFGATSYYYQGYMDEFGIWSRVLTQTEIEDLYNSGSGLFY